MVSSMYRRVGGVEQTTFVWNASAIIPHGDRVTLPYLTLNFSYLYLNIIITLEQHRMPPQCDSLTQLFLQIAKQNGGTVEDPLEGGLCNPPLESALPLNFDNKSSSKTDRGP